jgi:RimJ/RimL family protein N-acetyltransferase
VTVLTTDRLILRPISTDDLTDIRAIWTDLSFTRHIMGRVLDEEEIWMRFMRDLGHWQVKGYGTWTARTPDGAFVGNVGLLDYHRTLDPPFDAPEMGGGLAPAAQGKGMALEALGAILAWADAHLPDPKTVCMVSPENTPSMKLATRLGFTPYAETQYKSAPVILLQRPRRSAAL